MCLPWDSLCAALSYGLKAQVYRYEPQDLLEKGHFPCIIHWNVNHFVVLCGCERLKNGFFQKWAGYQAGMNTQTVKFANINHYLGLIPDIVTSLTNTAVLLLGVYLTMQGRFTVGMILAFQGFLGSFTAPAQSLIGAGQTLLEMRTNMERIDDVMEYPADVCYNDDFDENSAYGKLSGEVTLRDVSFGYSKLSPPIIEHFDLHLKPGVWPLWVRPAAAKAR